VTASIGSEFGDLRYFVELPAFLAEPLHTPPIQNPGLVGTDLKTAFPSARHLDSPDAVSIDDAKGPGGTVVYPHESLGVDLYP